MKTTILSLLLLISSGLLAYQSYELAAHKSSRQFTAARANFYEAALAFGCLEKQAIINAAEDQELFFVVHGEGGDLLSHGSFSPNTVDLINVDLGVDLFLTPSTFTQFPLDGDGCWIVR